MWNLSLCHVWLRKKCIWPGDNIILSFGQCFTALLSSEDNADFCVDSHIHATSLNHNGCLEAQYVLWEIARPGWRTGCVKEANYVISIDCNNSRYNHRFGYICRSRRNPSKCTKHRDVVRYVGDHGHILYDVRAMFCGAWQHHPGIRWRIRLHSPCFRRFPGFPCIMVELCHYLPCKYSSRIVNIRHVPHAARIPRLCGPGWRDTPFGSSHYW